MLGCECVEVRLCVCLTLSSRAQNMVSQELTHHVKCLLAVMLQAMTYEQAGRARRVVRLQLISPVSAAMTKLLAITQGSGTPAHDTTGVMDPPAEEHHVAGDLDSTSRSPHASDHGTSVAAEPSAFGAGGGTAARGKR